MKKLPGRSRGWARPIWGGLLLFSTAAVAALTPTEWSHRQSLQVPAAGLVRVELTPASFDAATSQQDDLRIIDANGAEIASLLDRPPLPVAHTVRPESFSVKLESGATVITVATGTKAALAAIRLETPHPFFLRAARVEISDDGSTWTKLDQGLPLFRQWGAEKLSLPLGDHTAAYVRVVVTDNRGGPMPFTGAWLNLSAAPAPALIPVGARITGRDEFAGETVLTLTLDGRHLPLAALEFQTQEPLFMRRVTVAVREVRDTVSGERVLGGGTIYRVALDGAPARAQLDLPVDFIPPTREVLVHIHNGDSPPLALEGIRVQRRPVSLMFMAPAPGTYTLLAGNSQVAAPRYDLAGFAGEMRAAGGTPVTPGDLAAMPNYRPRESLSAAPLPDVPLTGAPLDTKDWSERRIIGVERAGVQELELDLEALAHSRPDFADLRVVRGGNQIPYVLEVPALARSLTLQAAAAPDSKHPSVSIWRLQVPHAGAPLRRLVLTSATPLFQREFRIYEKVTSAEGHAYENVLGAGAWSRTPEPGVPETRIFDLMDRMRTDTLWIESDNGDNPAIVLGSVQAIYPVVRVIFKVAETDGFALVYGHKSASAPRYDLSLVAVKLLTSPRNVAKLAAGEPNTGSRNPFAGLKGGTVFWGALALVVIVLLVVVAKLLPKPPAA